MRAQQAGGMYSCVLTKIWEYPSGARVLTAHLADGRFIACGPFLTPPHFNNFFAPWKVFDAATQTDAIIWYIDDILRQDQEPTASTSSAPAPVPQQQPSATWTATKAYW